MKRLTVTIPEEMDERLAERVERGEYESKSEAVREFITRASEYEDRLHEVQRDLAECEREVERLRNEKRLILEDRDERTTLERYVEDELAYREAGIVTRAKWWLWGRG